MSNLYTISPHLPFLETLADYVIGLDNFSDALILLPSRRNCRSFSELLLARSERNALILPRIVPLGEVEDELMLRLACAGNVLDIPPAIGALERVMALRELVEETSTTPLLPHHSLMLAQSLARLMDACEREGVDIARLETLAPEAYANHWQLVLPQLRILTQAWPQELKKRGKMNPVARRNLQTHALIEAWKHSPPTHPIIAAGSTVSTRATSDLLACIAALPTGQVVLPGFNPAMSEEEMLAVDEAHPYYFMLQFLTGLSVAPRDITAIGEQALSQRARMMLSAFAPPTHIHMWKEDNVNVATALQEVRYFESATEQFEARDVALLVRSALQHATDTVMVVVNSQTHAAHLCAHLAHYGVAADSSHGMPLQNVEQGVFLRLVLACIVSDYAEADVLALLKHPFTHMGMGRAECLLAAREMDATTMRGIALEAKAEYPLLKKLHDALAPFARSLSRQSMSLADLLKEHIHTAQVLATCPEMKGEVRLWRGERGVFMAHALQEMVEAAAGHIAAPMQCYATLFESLFAFAEYRKPYGGHPRLRVLTPQEARLETADTVIIMGMNEGQIPALAAPSPWLSRPMQTTLGLPSNEAEASHTAHDVLMLSHAPRLVLSRSRAVDGAPARLSRYLVRLQLYAKNKGLPLSPHRFVEDKVHELVPISPPAPRPEVAVRPRHFSVSEFELLQRDPYAVYSKKILGLKPLEPLDALADAKLFGILMHAVFERFIAQPYDAATAHSTLMRIVDDVFKVVENQPILAVWKPRIGSAAEDFLREEAARRHAIASVRAEVKVKHNVTIGGEDFTITTSIDRVERRRDGSVHIIDYKTGNVPTKKDIAAGVACQLPMMAWLAEEQGVGGVSALEYWNINGRKPLECSYVSTCAQDARMWFEQAMLRYLDANTAYTVGADAKRFGAYQHLERIKEWL